MSLEDHILSLSQAVEENTRTLREMIAVFTEAKQQGARTNAAIEKEIVRQQIAEEKEEAGNDSPKPSTTTDTSPPSSNESRTVTYDDVKNVTIAVSKIDKAKAVAGLARFGVTTAKALNESQWLDYVVYMEKVAAGEIDPESSHG